jgi:hypothetical protein
MKAKKNTTIDFGCFGDLTEGQTHNQIPDYNKFDTCSPVIQGLPSSQEKDNSAIIQAQQEVSFPKVKKVGPS